MNLDRWDKKTTFVLRDRRMIFRKRLAYFCDDPKRPILNICAQDYKLNVHAMAWTLLIRVQGLGRSWMSNMLMFHAFFLPSLVGTSRERIM